MKVSKRLNLEEKIGKSNAIIDLVNKYFDIDCRVKNRFKDVINSRHIAIYLIHKNISMSYKEIGKLFLSKSDKPLAHCTIMHAKDKVKDYLDIKDIEVSKSVNELKEDARLISKFSHLELLKYKEKQSIMDILGGYTLTELTELKLKLKDKKLNYNE